MANENKKRALYIGLGGSGVTTVLKIRQRLLEKTEGAGPKEQREAFNDLYRFILIDTDKLSSTLTFAGIDQSEEQELRLQNAYVNLGPTIPNLVYQTAIDATKSTPRQKRLIEFVGASQKDLKDKPLITGAGANRINSRIGLAECYTDALEKITNAIAALRDTENQTGIKPDANLDVWVVSGLSGGTGSGIVMDVLYLTDRLMRQADYKAPMIRTVLFMPQSFTKNPAVKPEVMLSNGYAAMQEFKYFKNQKLNQFKYVSVVPDLDAWSGSVYASWSVYLAAITIDSTINGGGSMNDKAIYENTAEMLAYLQLSTSEAKMASPIDNLIEEGDSITAFGYVALKKPVELFTKYVGTRRMLEVATAFLGAELQENSDTKKVVDSMIEQVVESQLGRLLGRGGLEEAKQEAKLQEISFDVIDENLLTILNNRDEEQLVDTEGRPFKEHLRKEISVGFGKPDVVGSFGQWFDEEFELTFFKENLDFKKSAIQTAPNFVNDVVKKLAQTTSEVLGSFRGQTSSKMKDQLMNSFRKAINRTICDHGVAFTLGLVKKCDNILDAYRHGQLSKVSKNLQKIKLDLQSSIESDATKIRNGDAARLLKEKIDKLVTVVRESLVAECHEELIAWLCERDSGWLDREVLTGLNYLKVQAVGRQSTANTEFTVSLPGLFRAASNEATTRYLPDPADMLGDDGGWNTDQQKNEFSRFYDSLFSTQELSAASLLRKIASGPTTSDQSKIEEKTIFSAFLNEKAGGSSMNAEAIVEYLRNTIAESTHSTLATSSGSLASSFLKKSMTEIFNSYPGRQKEIRDMFNAEDRFFFPLAVGDGSNKKRLSIYAGNDQDFAESLGCDTGDFVTDANPNSLVKFYFKGPFTFEDYSYFESAMGCYKSICNKVTILHEEKAHQPHIHRGFLNAAPTGESVAECMEVLNPDSKETAGDIDVYNKDVFFASEFIAFLLYAELPNHVDPNDIGLIFEQELIVSETCYSPLIISNSNAVLQVSWVKSADAVMLVSDKDAYKKVKIQLQLMQQKVRQFRGTIFNAYNAMKKDVASLSVLLKDYESKLRRVDSGFRTKMISGIDPAVLVLQHKLDACASDPKVSVLWKELPSIRAILAKTDGVVEHFRTDIFGSR